MGGLSLDEYNKIEREIRFKISDRDEKLKQGTDKKVDDLKKKVQEVK